MNAIEFALKVISAIEKLGIPYMTVGSFSSNVYGIPRSTKDADFVLELGDHSIAALASEVGPEFKLDPQMSFESVTGTMRYRLHHRESPFFVELFLLSDDPHDQMRFERRVSGKIGERMAVVPTAEDVVITKLRWSHQGKRHKDVDDVKDVLVVQAGNLDLPYIRQWCDRHGTLALFEEVLKEAADA